MTARQIYRSIRYVQNHYASPNDRLPQPPTSPPDYQIFVDRLVDFISEPGATLSPIYSQVLSGKLLPEWFEARDTVLPIEQQDELEIVDDSLPSTSEIPTDLQDQRPILSTRDPGDTTRLPANGKLRGVRSCFRFSEASWSLFFVTTVLNDACLRFGKMGKKQDATRRSSGIGSAGAGSRSPCLHDSGNKLLRYPEFRVGRMMWAESWRCSRRSTAVVARAHCFVADRPDGRQHGGGKAGRFRLQCVGSTSVLTAQHNHGLSKVWD